MVSQREQERLERDGDQADRIHVKGASERASQPLRAGYCVRERGRGCTHKYQAVAEPSGS